MCFTVTTTSAGLISLGTALALGLAHPFWAPMAVWLVAQPTRGLLLERAGARVCGTAVGSLIGFGLITSLGAHPPALLCAMLGWIALCTAGARLFRFHRSYAMLLAGYTAAVVILAGFADLAHREVLSLMRVECTLIGVAAALLLGFICIRPSFKTDLHARLVAFSAAAHAMAAQERVAPIPHDQFTALLMDAGEVEGMIDERLAGSLTDSDRGAKARSLLSTGIRGVVDARLQRLGGLPQAAECPRANGAESALPPVAVLRADDLIECAQLRSGTRPHAIPLARLDAMGALRAACRSVLCLGGLIIIWQTTKWHYGDAMVTTAAIFTALFSTHNNPVAATRTVLAGSVLGASAAIVYRNLEFLHGPTITSILIGVSPFLTIGAYAMSRPRTNKLAIDYIMTFLLVGQPMLHLSGAGLAASLQQAGAILAGVAAVILSFQFLVPASPAHLMRSLDQSLTKASQSAWTAQSDTSAEHHKLSAILRAIKMGDIARSFGVPIPSDLLDRLSGATSLVSRSRGSP